VCLLPLPHQLDSPRSPRPVGRYHARDRRNDKPRMSKTQKHYRKQPRRPDRPRQSIKCQQIHMYRRWHPIQPLFFLELTLASVVQSPPRIRGVHTKIVNPAKNRHTAYDINIIGHCQVKTIFHLGFQTPSPLLCVCDSLCNPCGPSSDSIKMR
jgi:hypothetical protein